MNSDVNDDDDDDDDECYYSFCSDDLDDNVDQEHCYQQVFGSIIHLRLISFMIKKLFAFRIN